MPELTMVEAINLALHQEMERDERVVVLGQDVGVGEGVFRVTEGLLESFGEQRVLDTPLAESAIVGTSIGMAVAGLHPVCELQFSGFSYFALHQFESHAARLRWRSRGGLTVPMVARMPYGAGAHALEHHSESKEVLYAHNPGLKVVIPSGPRTARALLVSAIRDPDPVVFMESKALYRSFREEVPDDEETLPIGPARVLREGDAVTLISYGTMLRRSLEAADILREEDGVEVELIDVPTVAPLDGETIASSVHSTGRAVVVHEAHRSYGPAGEIVAQLVEKEFLYLEAPVRRVTGWDVIVPYFAREQAYLPSVERIVRAVRETLEF
jgi:pyruvate dehydrogenase E1 component beta subunit